MAPQGSHLQYLFVISPSGRNDRGADK